MGNQFTCNQCCIQSSQDPNEFTTFGEEQNSFNESQPKPNPQDQDLDLGNGDDLDDYRLPNNFIFQDIQQHISPFEIEKGLEFSSNGIIKYVDQMLQENDPKEKS